MHDYDLNDPFGHPSAWDEPTAPRVRGSVCSGDDIPKIQDRSALGVDPQASGPKGIGPISPSLAELAKAWPEWVTRSQATSIFPGLFTARYLRRLDARSRGPTPFRYGPRGREYLTIGLLAWIENRWL